MRFVRNYWVVVLLAAVLIAAPQVISRIGATTPPAERTEGIVTRHIDGDTFVMDGNVRVRLWGIDAPEMNTPEGVIARGFLIGALPAGSTVRCEQKDTDSYGRMVARCFTAQGLDMAELMLKSEQACEWRTFSQGFYSGVAKCQRLPNHKFVRTTE